MDKKFDRFKRQQQRLWRKAAASILSLHHNLVISLSFLIIILFGILWVFINQKLEHQLLQNVRAYGYYVTQFAATDLKQLIVDDDTQLQEKYLQRLVEYPLIKTARLFNHQGSLLANSLSDSPRKNKPSIINESNSLILLEDINLKQKRIGILQLEMDRTSLEKPIHNLLETISIISVLTMAIAILIVWLLTRRLTQPLRKLLDFPIDEPQNGAIEEVDISSELKLMLENSASVNASPAPISSAEASGIHQILSVDSVAERGEVIILRLYISDLAKWLKLDSGNPNVDLLRQLDRLLIVTIHNQQGHLLNFDGITAQACFGLDGDLSSATFRAASCSLLLRTLLEEIGLDLKISLLKEERLLVHHMKRTPVTIPIHIIDDEPVALFSNSYFWIILHKNIFEDRQLLEHIRLQSFDDNWKTISEIRQSAQSMLERQLAWIKYLLSQSEK